MDQAAKRWVACALVLSQVPVWAAGLQPLQPVTTPTVVAQPITITALTPETPDATARPDGTSTVNFTIQGKGTGNCDVALMTGQSLGYVSVPITAQGGFSKTVAVNFAKPGVTQMTVYGLQCSGKVTLMYNIKPDPNYPCSLYPGFKKETPFNGNPNAAICVPPVAPVGNVDASRFNCGNGLVFSNAGGYVFGCMPPGFLSH